MPSLVVLGLLLASVAGCQQSVIRGADRRVYSVIEDRQRAALGAANDVRVGEELGNIGDRSSTYDFVPHPVDSGVPERFLRDPEATTESEKHGADPAPIVSEAAQPTVPITDVVESPDVKPAERAEAVSAPGGEDDALMSPSIFDADQLSLVQTFGLQDSLAYALRHARMLQSAKEELYIAALALTLERHLWTPQFVSTIQTEYANYGQVRDFDHAMSAVSDFAVSQRLPYGGDVTARVINTLMRDLGAHVTTGETGNFILEANLPLLRGAGRTAYESRYQAERSLIYAVRNYEQFRRAFVVDVATGYFELQQSKSSVANTYKSYQSRRKDWEKADFINRIGQSVDVFQAPRAKSSLRQAEAGLVSAKEQYASVLDRFKVLIGMPVDTLLEVVDQQADEESAALDALLPPVQVDTAVEIALKYRLDLLNVIDEVDDRRRGVLVAKNGILPDLNFSGSATLDTDPDRKNSVSYNTERTTWRAIMQLQMDDRFAERNAYRESLINLRRSERAVDEAADNVRADVRRAIRRIAQQENLRAIQAANVEENELRLAAARAQFDLGKSTNQDVVDAEDDLLTARNQLADAVAGYRNAILAFRRDTGTLRVDDDGTIRNE